MYSMCTIIYSGGAQLLNLILECRTCILACPSSGAYIVLLADPALRGAARSVHVCFKDL
jgi:hypothetical protein